MTAPDLGIRQAVTADLTDVETAAIRALLGDAFADHGEGLTDDDWEHASGGIHFLLVEAGSLVAHAAVVERELHAAGMPLRAGYVEAVAARTDNQRRGFGTRVMRALDDHIRDAYQLGALSTGRPAFYARLGWARWLGPTGVRTPTGTILTPEDDDGIMVLTTSSSPPLERRALLTCPWRSGDVW